MSEFQREIYFVPAFDKRSADPSKDYGIGGLRCSMVLKGKKGAVDFYWSTGIYLPENNHKSEPLGFSVSYHSPVPLSESDEISSVDCNHLNGPCYSDRSGLLAEKYLDALIRHGSDKVWEMLEGYYNTIFEGSSDD